MNAKVRYLLRNPLQLPILVITRLPYFRFIRETGDYQGQVGFGFWFRQKVLNWGGNRAAYWPVHWSSKVHDAENILVGIDAYPGVMNGCYIQGKNGIVVGDYTQVGPNVVIVSANHDLYDSRQHVAEGPVTIGRYCWIGAGAKIMPGVTLGDWTIVAAGAVVTRSFPEGHCVVAGVPASEIQRLDKERCRPFRNRMEYNGYVRSEKFADYRKRNLKI